MSKSEMLCTVSVSTGRMTLSSLDVKITVDVHSGYITSHSVESTVRPVRPRNAPGLGSFGVQRPAAEPPHYDAFNERGAFLRYLEQQTEYSRLIRRLRNRSPVTPS